MHVREDTDLDFKREVYAQSEKGHRDAASDVAAMANGPGGAIFLGIRDHDTAAVEVTPVEFSESTELRLGNTIISQTAPKPDFRFHRIPWGADPKHGVYLIVVPPSPYAPHAVRLNDRLGYPKRAGIHTRWLAESEVADAYRARFLSGEERAERLNGVLNAGQNNLGEGVWLSIALVPVVAGNFAMGYRSMQRELSNASQRWYGQGFATHVFTRSPQCEAALGRVVLCTDHWNGHRRSKSGHAEMHRDGSVFVATIVGGHLSRELMLGLQPTAWSVEDEMLVEQAIASVGMAVEFATERAGASGDAYLSISIVTVGAPAEVELIHIRQGPPMQFSGSHRVSGVERSTVLISLDDAATPQGRLVIARLALMGIFQWFGYPEVPQITDAGNLRRPYFGHQNRRGVESWAGSNGVEIVDTTVEVEP
jgi:schlafen family protein